MAALPSPSRRSLIAGAGAVVAGGAVLAACGGESSGPAPASTGGSNSGSGGAAAPAQLAALDSIPDGSTVAVTNPQGGTVLLTRSGGTVTGLDAKCPHQGCTVAPKGATLECPCHQSQFQPGSGAVITGPAEEPLAKVNVTVANGQVTLA